MCKKRLVRLYESLLSAISRRTMKFLLLGARVVMLWAERRPRLEGVTFEDTAASEFLGSMRGDTGMVTDITTDTTLLTRRQSAIPDRELQRGWQFGSRRRHALEAAKG